MTAARRSVFVWFFATLAIACAWALLPEDAVAARGAATAAGTAGAAGLMKSASLIGPMGISPFFAVAAFGIAASLGLWVPPEGLAPFMHPVAWLAFLLLALVIQFGRSTKLTKPLAEALGAGESLFALLAAIMIAVPHFGAGGPSAPVAQAGVASGILFLLGAIAAVITVVVVRTALDILIWLSPVPLIDAVFQIFKAVITAGLIALAIVSPIAAIVVNLLLVVGAFLVLRWAIRTARFGVTIAKDLTIGRFGKRLALPRDKVMPEDLGPFSAFVLDVEGLKRRTAGSIELKAGRWFVSTPRAVGEDRERPLGDQDKAVATRGLMGIELSLPGGTILLPPRYSHLFAEITRQTGAQIGERPSLLGGRRVQAAQAQASTI